MNSPTLTVLGLLFGIGLIVSGGIAFSRAANKYVSVSQLIIGALFVVLAILLFAGVHL